MLSLHLILLVDLSDNLVNYELLFEELLVRLLFPTLLVEELLPQLSLVLHHLHLPSLLLLLQLLCCSLVLPVSIASKVCLLTLDTKEIDIFKISTRNY